jgi:hypothetical protein
MTWRGTATEGDPVEMNDGASAERQYWKLLPWKPRKWGLHSHFLLPKTIYKAP